MLMTTTLAVVMTVAALTVVAMLVSLAETARRRSACLRLEEEISRYDEPRRRGRRIPYS